MNREYVPVDEGEAEAQPDLPVVTIRLLDPHQEQDGEGFPRKVRFEVPAAAGRRKVLDDHVQERAEMWLTTSGYRFDDPPKPEWTDTEDGRARTVTYTVTGWV